MELTASFERVLPPVVAERYDWAEVRNAAAVLSACAPDEWADVVTVLGRFRLLPSDITAPGGNKSAVAARLDDAFRAVGWREGRHDTRIISSLTVMPWRGAGEVSPVVRTSEVMSEGYKVDNVKGRVALDVEWNAKDGNLDRDIGAYRALYDAGIIDGAVLVTRSQGDTTAMAAGLGVARFQTTTTTNLEKLVPRLVRGDSGGCPLLAVAITARCIGGGEDVGLRPAPPQLWE